MLKAVSYPSVQTCVRMLAVLAAFSPAPTSGWVATTACRSLGGLGSRWMSLSARTRASCGTLATSRMARGLGSVQMRGTESAHGQPPWPRIVIVSRRHLRKNKQVDFVGEYHIDLLQRYGAVPILIPRTTATTQQLEAYLVGGIDGVLVVEGNDLGAEYKPYGSEVSMPNDKKDELFNKHPGDMDIDNAKDALEMELIRKEVIGKGVPYLGLCRGSQMLNVAMGGTLYFDVSTEVQTSVKHIDYDNYDGYRHKIDVVPNTPLAGWFEEEYKAAGRKSFELQVNSYHHQGIRTLAENLEPMCYCQDGLVEGYYDTTMHEPSQGKYRVGLQWHPERMLGDYAGCARVYQHFVEAAASHRRLILEREKKVSRMRIVGQAVVHVNPAQKHHHVRRDLSLRSETKRE
mmetsp:Transcript_31234/g.70277  ORF Transcript_31234/g.70277 Transcript_31234/m.70277 type:complete len:402 (-) Transcript_31234:183-1388(-)